MAAKKSSQHIYTVPASEDLDVFRQDMVLSIDVVLGFIAWLTLYISLQSRQMGYFWVTVLLAAGALGSSKLRAVNLRAAMLSLILAMMGAALCLKVFVPNSPAQYFFPIVVIVSGLLEINWSVFLVAVLASIAVTGIARAHGISWFNSYEILTPNLLIYITAFIIWLSARQLMIALGWMRTTYQQAQTLLEQLRDERGSMARMLKQLEEAYRRIEKMNNELVEAYGVAEEARRLKAEFAANISHELRTPLNIIIGFSETMANAPETYAGVAWSPILRGDIEQIYQSSRHLLSLIDDILDLAALDMRQLGMTIEETAIEPVILQAVDMMKDLFHAKKLYLRVEVEPGLPRLRIDATRIRQVLINLLTNASRFTTSGGVTISARQTGREVQVALADTGIGIAPQDVAKVFDEFGQVDSSIRRKHEGSGLGVPLSKRFIELHNGRMWLESQPGQGTTFFFTLPIQSGKQPELERTGGDWTASAAPGRKTVLFMEPDLTMLNTVKRHLGQYDVVRVRRSDNLPEFIERYRPTALIVDHQGTDNIESDLAVPRDLPVLSVHLPGQLQNPPSLGIKDFLLKPITRERLFEAIEGLGRPARNVLVVDEDPALVDLVSRMLQTGGCGRIYKAWGGSEALTVLRREPVDLVLLDWLRTDVTGLMVLEEMRRMPGLADIPVIMLGSEWPDEMIAKQGLDLRLIRTEEASVAEMVRYLEILVGALPPRGLTDAEAVPPAPAAPAVPPVS